MKKYRLLVVLLLSIIISTGCTSSVEKEKANDIIESTSSFNDEEESEAKSISEHFTKDLTDEIWFEIETGSESEVSLDSIVTSILLTNDTSNESSLSEGFAMFDNNEKGYILLEMPEYNSKKLENPENINLKLGYFYELYVNNKLNQDLYHYQIDRNTMQKEIMNKGYSVQYFLAHSDELQFFHRVVNLKDGDKKVTQLISFQGKSEPLQDDGRSEGFARRHIFQVSEDEISIELKAEGFPPLYLVGYRDKDGYGIYKYFVKFSDEKENFVLDTLYSNDDIEVVNVN